MTVTTRVLAIVALLSAPALAAERPKVELPSSVPPAERHAFTLDNGLEVIVLPFGDVPKVSVRLVVDTGNVDEKRGETWLADLTAKLLELGTADLDAAALARTVAQWGGDLAIHAGSDTLWVGGTVLADHAADYIGVIGALVQRPRLPADELPRLKADLVRDLNLQKSQPSQIADARLFALLYPDQPYGRYFPTEEQLRSYKIEQIRRFLEDNVNAGRAHLYVAGKLDPDAVEKAARSAFSGWRGGKPVRARQVKTASARAIHFIERTGAVQSTLRLALPVVQPSHPDYVALQVTNHLLGGSFASRITSNIREQKGYTYSPRSMLSARQGAVHWVEMADVTTAVTGAAIKEIEKEIARLRSEPPPAEELDAIKANLVGSFLIGQSSREGRINWQRFLALHGLPPDFDYVGKLQAVTPEQVTATAKKYLDPARMTMVVVGDRKQVLPQLKGLAKIAK